MPETKTKTQRSAASNAPPATARRTAAKTPKRKPKATVDKTAGLSNEVLASVEAGQREAIDAVRKFMDSVDKSLPLHGEGPSKRQEIVDSALEMADRLVHTQYDFLRKVVRSAGESLNRSDDAK